MNIKPPDRQRRRLLGVAGMTAAAAQPGMIHPAGGSRDANKAPLPPEAECAGWCQFYFATERGRAGRERHRKEFAKRIWQTASPKWDFDDATFDRSAQAFHDPDHVAVVIHNHRWRIGLAEAPVIRVPTITLEGDANGAPHPDPASYSKRFSGKYAHRLITGGVGHNLPQKAPRAFADAVIEAAGY